MLACTILILLTICIILVDCILNCGKYLPKIRWRTMKFKMKVFHIAGRGGKLFQKFHIILMCDFVAFGDKDTSNRS